LFNVPTKRLNHFLLINPRKWLISRLQGSNTTWVAAVSNWKVTKLFQAQKFRQAFVNYIIQIVKES
jgi:hypothetical protein